MYIHVAKRGSDRFLKTSYPVRTGVYTEVETDTSTLHFNLNQEIIRAQGKGGDWPHPQEWLQRTAGNDWVYYSTGGYTGVFETTGEYYLPNLPYSTNNALGGSPLDRRAVVALIDSWHPALLALLADSDRLPADAVAFLAAAVKKDPAHLARRAHDLFAIIGGRPTVLPPDTRHVDYRVIPLTVCRGCLYKCSFCRVKNGTAVTPLSRPEIDEQLDRLAAYFGDELTNHNSVFLGEHDALLTDPELLCHAVDQAHHRLRLADSSIAGSNVFLFGSVGSLLRAPRELFNELDRLPGRVFINIGLESADQATLDRLGKPLTPAAVRQAFAMLLEINESFPTIEITANFVMDDKLDKNHYTSLVALIRDGIGRARDKGAIYLSPLRFNDPSRARLFAFYELKRLSRLPLFLYTIQRL
ncbi:MAG: radical SAM domain-containing protein [Desulfofustis sp.]|nr:radical SAM domain-containing protein [Desulfofustis sp.]